MNKSAFGVSMQSVVWALAAAFCVSFDFRGSATFFGFMAIGCLTTLVNMKLDNVIKRLDQKQL